MRMLTPTHRGMMSVYMVDMVMAGVKNMSMNVRMKATERMRDGLPESASGVATDKPRMTSGASSVMGL